MFSAKRKAQLVEAPHLLAIAVFALVAAVAVVLHVKAFSPVRVGRPDPVRESGPRDAMRAAMATNAVLERYREIASFGSRAPGQEGLQRTREAIGRAFGEHGLEVFEQVVDIPYPLLREGSGYVSNATARIPVWPLAPNYVQTVTTGPNGLDGELFLATEESVRNGRDFTGKIAVIDTAGSVFEDFGLDAVRYIDVGFSAVVYTHADGLQNAPWNDQMSLAVTKDLPANLVRVAAEPEILDHIGERVHMDVRSVWRNRRTWNVVGRLRADGGVTNSSVLVIPIEYDAMSLLPDVAHGSLQAFQTSVLLQTLEGMAGCREHLRRDVVFVAATGISQRQAGLCRLISTIGENGRRDYPQKFIAGRIAENDAALARLAEIVALFDDPAFAVAGETEATRQALASLPAETRKCLFERFSALMRKTVFNQAEALLQARIAYQRKPFDTSTPEFRRFRVEKRRYDELNNLSALPLTRMLDRPGAGEAWFPMPDGTSATLRDSLRAEIARFIAFHEDRGQALARDLSLQRMFAEYSDVLVLGPRCSPSSTGEGVEKVGFSSGKGISRGEGFELFQTIVNEAVHSLGYTGEIDVVKGDWGGFDYIYSEDTELNTMPFAIASYPAFSVVSAKERANAPTFPFRQERMEKVDTAGRVLQVFGEVALKLADGRGAFKRFPIWVPNPVRGSVLAAGIGNSAVPNYAVEGAVICSLDHKPAMITDIYGNYENPFMLLPAFTWLTWRSYDAFLFDDNGEVRYVKDYGSAAQLISASKGMRFDNVPVSHIVYRAAPVTILNRVNPQSLRSFTDFSFIGQRGLNAFPSTCVYRSEKAMMDFLPPDERFFLLLKSGAPGNDLVATTRAFCLGTLNTNTPAFRMSSNEIDGPGYLAQDTRYFRNVAFEAMASMAWLAGKRLDLQKKYGMADEMTLAFDANTAKIANDIAAHGAEQCYMDRQREYSHGLSYQILNHPVIRGSISEAVAGILWYLGLLVPFVFFFEKLLFGFTDIRKRLAVQTVTFIAVFALLRVLHPAFQMIRSSAMILLGFVIMLTVGTVTMVLSGKFKENLDAMRSARGVVKGAAGDKLGIIATAFMLGLNNMHKRKVRTGLTCATLVLMTFVMICFTSVQSNVVETERATGSADYQGIVIRKRQYRPIYASEVDALRAAFSSHVVNRRSIYGGYYNHASQVADVPYFEIEKGEGESARLALVCNALGFDSTEPLAGRVRMLSTNGWFTAAQQRQTAPPYPIILSDVLADKLGITPEQVDHAPVPVSLNGVPSLVYNIFDSSRFAEVHDIDGRDLLPFDGLAINNPKYFGWCVIIAEEDDPKVAPSDLILVLNDQLSMDERGIRTASVVVDMGNVPFAVAKQEISMYKEQSGVECCYALNGMAFNGRRARFRTIAGVVDLLIPLLIAAITVLNTMKGSVYERRGEIFVYNAVGIAPRYVFFMFVAEALVYSVVGAVMGYLLSQGIGRVLAALNLTGGMNMNFTNAATIYASLAIAAATLLSTVFPARAAMAIARPADNSGWALPAPDEDDCLEITLPFTFTHEDRIAVLAFFYNFFDGYGEGSAGPFFAGLPFLKIADHLDPLADNGYIPALEVQVWLKPFDLGVSQRIVIELGTDPETGEYIAKMILRRVTGTREAWVRLNKTFVAAIRRHFLHWRAVPHEQKAKLFAQAKRLLESSNQ